MVLYANFSKLVKKTIQCLRGIQKVQSHFYVNKYMMKRNSELKFSLKKLTMEKYIKQTKIYGQREVLVQIIMFHLINICKLNEKHLYMKKLENLLGILPKTFYEYIN